DGFFLQLIDLLLRITQHFLEHFAIMLAQQWSRFRDRFRAAGQLCDGTHELNGTEYWIRDVDHQLPGSDMRTVEDLLSRLHGTDRQPDSQQLFRGLRLGLSTEPVIDDIAEPTRHVLGTIRPRCCTLMADQIRPSNGLTEFSPVAFGGDNESDPA